MAARRFQQRYRNQLWQSDLKYGPYLPHGEGGAMKQVFLVVFIDDATRFIVHGEFVPVMDQRLVESAFRQAIQKYGVPEGQREAVPQPRDDKNLLQAGDPAALHQTVFPRSLTKSSSRF